MVGQTYHHHLGFVLYDLEEDKMVVSVNGDKYFTPASNAKVLTLATALSTLSDSIPSLHYVKNQDSLIFWGTGDPSFLFLDSVDRTTWNFLDGGAEKLYYASNNFQDEPFGAGWAWDDYPFNFQVEKSALPIYGNRAAVRWNKNLAVLPSILSQRFTEFKPLEPQAKLSRAYHSNNFYYANLNPGFTRHIPFINSDSLLVSMLGDTLKSPIGLISKTLPTERNTLYSLPSDSLYKWMMVPSDNFIAEQLLLVVAGAVSDTLQTAIAINYAKKHVFLGLPQPIKWVDGSGLSRYNLVTPESMVAIWRMILDIKEIEKLKAILPAGGRNGTLKNWYLNNEPYIYGKTGTLSNNHNLSGIILTDKSKTYLFAFMNNHYLGSSSNIKKEMERILWYVKSNF